EHSGDLLRSHIRLRVPECVATIPRAFNEMRARDLRESLDVVERESKRTIHESVDHQAMLGRIDDGDARVMPLEVQVTRRDRSGEILQWRERAANGLADGCARRLHGG